MAHFCPVTTTSGTVSSDDVVAARGLLHDVISDTPVLHSRVLSETVAGPVFHGPIKITNLTWVLDERGLVDRPSLARRRCSQPGRRLWSWA